MLRLAQAAASSPTTSRSKGEDSQMLNLLTLERNMAKPSWCFAVKTMYFAPQLAASCTQASASRELTAVRRCASAASSALRVEAEPSCRFQYQTPTAKKISSGMPMHGCSKARRMRTIAMSISTPSSPEPELRPES